MSARHATIYAQALWRRHRALRPAAVTPADVAQRMDLLIAAVFGRAPRCVRRKPRRAPSSLGGVSLRERPRCRARYPRPMASCIWLPATPASMKPRVGGPLSRMWRLQQAMRAPGERRIGRARRPLLLRDVYLLVEAHAADDGLAGSCRHGAPLAAAPEDRSAPPAAVKLPRRAAARRSGA